MSKILLKNVCRSRNSTLPLWSDFSCETGKSGLPFGLVCCPARHWTHGPCNSSPVVTTQERFCAEGVGSRMETDGRRAVLTQRMASTVPVLAAAHKDHWFWPRWVKGSLISHFSTILSMTMTPVRRSGLKNTSTAGIRSHPGFFISDYFGGQWNCTFSEERCVSFLKMNIILSPCCQFSAVQGYRCTFDLKMVPEVPKIPHLLNIFNI